MKRREFLIRAAAVAAVGNTRRAWAQGVSQADPAKLARIAVTAITFLNQLGYKGLFSIEVNNGHEGIRPIYDIVLANI